MAALPALLLGALLAAGSPEFRFVDEEDDARAGKLLEPLLKKYDRPGPCADLLKTLRTKRAFGGESKDRETLEFPCADGKTRSFTWILPSKYSAAKPVQQKSDFPASLTDLFLANTRPCTGSKK